MEYLAFFILFLFALLFVVAVVFFQRILGGVSPNPIKQETYECGIPPTKTYVRYSVKFFVVALIFLIFDIEVVFFYPWAVIFKDLGLFGLIEMGVFLFFVLLGYLYAVKKNVFHF